MKWKHAFFLLLLVSIIWNCSSSKELYLESSRTTSPREIFSFHNEISLKVGWMPYQNHQIVKTNSHEWRVVSSSDESQISAAPVILVTYPETADSILLDMNTPNELLGKLIKHSAMTQLPIQRPYTSFFEKASCESCHPQFRPVDFDR